MPEPRRRSLLPPEQEVVMKNMNGGYLGGADGKSAPLDVFILGPCQAYGREERPRTDPRALQGGEVNSPDAS